MLPLQVVQLHPLRRDSAMRESSSAPSVPELFVRQELAWTVGLLWLIGIVPAMGLGVLMLGGLTGPLIAGVSGAVALTLLIIPVSRLAVARAYRRRPGPTA